MGAITFAAPPIGIILLYFIAGKVRKSNKVTVPEIMEARYGKTASIISALCVMLAYVGVLATQLKAAADEMDDHSQREEVIKALSDGSARVTRHSSTLGADTYYCAIRLENGDIIRVSSTTSDMWELYDKAVKIVVLLGFGILLASIVLSVVLTKQLVAPISGLTADLDEIEDKVPYPELRPFAMSLREYRLRERQNEQQRREFTANVSHELKTPITSVRGYAELLSQDFVKDEATRKDFLARILKETEHMTSLIDDILMISRLESKDAEVTLSKVNLKSVMDEVLESLTPQAASCKVEISGSCGNVILQASLQQMRELLSNLISNGIKYNHPGGHVWTKIWQEPEAVYIEVKDDGVGIDPEDQKRVFERFFRVDKGRSRKMGGTGLGLSIVKHITAYYGGSVRLTSEPGAGSTFFVEIPMSGINKM